MTFRYDINILRAIAVLAVVIFHFNSEWLSGGFAGVDVFFVISGFLMTTIIFKEIDKENFNIFEFYIRRANRIIPVLFSLSIFLIIFGIFYLIPSDLEILGKQIQKSSTFTSNILFSKEGGYFDTGEKSKWLLHTWSLSVEWQFYIIYPATILLLTKFFSKKTIKKIVIIFFIISLIFCIYLSHKDSKTAYFLLSCRAWEMLLGGIAYLYPLHIKNKFSLQILGFILIIISYFCFSENILWPGYMALIPTLGTFLVIVSNSPNNIITNNTFLNNIGKWSYSIYVWHWPIVVFGVYFSLKNWWLYGIPLSILFGLLSYHFIEKIKFKNYKSWKDFYKSKPLYMFLFILSFSTIIRETNGLDFIYPSQIKTILNESKNKNPYSCDSAHQNNILFECKIGNDKNIKAIVIGDSHADSITTAISASMNLNKDGIISISTGGCPFLLDAHIKDTEFCYYLNNQRIKWLIKNKIKYSNTALIIASRWVNSVQGENDPERITGKNYPILYSDSNPGKDLLALFHEKLNNTVSQIPKEYRIYIMQPIPEMGVNIPKAIAKNIHMNRSSDVSISYQDYLNRSKDVRYIINNIAETNKINTLDPATILCKSGQCISTYHNRPIYRDGDHLSEFGNKLLTPMFKNII